MSWWAHKTRTQHKAVVRALYIAQRLFDYLG